jgi:hypothetical protein
VRDTKNRSCLRGEKKLARILMHLLTVQIEGAAEEALRKSTLVYKCDVFARKPRWFRVKDLGDVTLFVSSNFVTGHGGASVAGLRKNFVYFSEPLDGWQAGPNHVELNNIANGNSKMLAYRENVRGSSKALCWIQPKPNIHGHKVCIYLSG